MEGYLLARNSFCEWANFAHSWCSISDFWPEIVGHHVKITLQFVEHLSLWAVKAESAMSFISLRVVTFPPQVNKAPPSPVLCSGLDSALVTWCYLLLLGCSSLWSFSSLSLLHSPHAPCPQSPLSSSPSLFSLFHLVFLQSHNFLLSCNIHYHI